MWHLTPEALIGPNPSIHIEQQVIANEPMYILLDHHTNLAETTWEQYSLGIGSTFEAADTNNSNME